MIKSSIQVIDKFKKVEKRIEVQYPTDKVKHVYVLYDYTSMDEDMIHDDIISCLDRIPSKFKLIDDYMYSDKCYVLELNSYIMKNKNIEKIGNFKLKFGL